MEKLQCATCGVNDYPVVIIRMMKTPDNLFKITGNNPITPKYTFHLKALCSGCGKYLKFIKQTDEIISQINSRLGSIPLKSNENGHF